MKVGIEERPGGTGCQQAPENWGRGRSRASPCAPQKEQPSQGLDLGLPGSTPVRQYVIVLGHLGLDPWEMNPGAVTMVNHSCLKSELSSTPRAPLTSFAASGKSLQASEHPLLILHMGLEKSAALDFPMVQWIKNPLT